MGPMHGFRHRVACLLCVLLTAACETGTSPSPGGSASPGVPTTPSPAPSVPAATPSPSFTVLPVFTDAITDAAFDTLLATADGFVAAGASLKADGVPLMADGSADGRTWQGLAADEVFGGPLAGLAVGPLGWVAAEQVATTEGPGAGTALWHSPDGRRWERLADQADLGHSFPGPVSAGAWGFAMLGQAIDSGGTSFPAAWVSRDGRTWRLTPASMAYPERVLVLDDRVVLLGQGSAAFTLDGSTWIDAGPVPGGEGIEIGVAAGLGTAVLASFAAPGSRLWRGTFVGAGSDVSLDWEPAGLPGEGSLGLAGVATGPLGALVVGFDRSSFLPIAWAATDGRAWQRADLDAGAFGGGVPSLLAVGTESFVALGWDVSEGGDSVARAWTSQDGLRWSRSESDALGELPGPPSRECPSSVPTKAAELIAMVDAYPSVPGAVWPFCFENRTLTLEGYVGQCDGCGGASNYVGSPDWLLDALGYADFWLGASAGDWGPGTISVQVDPERPVTIPAVGARVRVTGHFDDAAASTCRLVPYGDAAVPPAGATVATCRRQFVVTAITVLSE